MEESRKNHPPAVSDGIRHLPVRGRVGGRIGENDVKYNQFRSLRRQAVNKLRVQGTVPGRGHRLAQFLVGQIVQIDQSNLVGWQGRPQQFRAHEEREIITQARQAIAKGRGGEAWTFVMQRNDVPETARKMAREELERRERR